VLVKAPWTDEQIDALERFQQTPGVHPYTCPQHSTRELVATRRGWICRYCEYTQDWANDLLMLQRIASDEPP
jgi:hypothetical protein